MTNSRIKSSVIKGAHSFLAESYCSISR